MRPGVLAEPRPQERVQRHTMERTVDFVCCSPTVQILDALVPLMVEQLPDVFRFFDRRTTFPEQVTAVPKILPEDVPFRAVLRDPQLAEQLVEVPTIVSNSPLQRMMEHNVGIPVPGRGRRISGLQGFSPQQNSTAPRFSKKRISEQIVEQIVDIPGGGLQDFRPGQSSSSSLHVPARISEEGFRTFRQIKKSAKVGPHSRSELLPEPSPSTRRAYAVPMVPEQEEPVLAESEEEEDPNSWRDEFGRLWMRSALNPRRWYLLGTGLDVDIIWEEPG